jgi:ketopantoate reductase
LRKERTILHTINRIANSIGHILRRKGLLNTLLKETNRTIEVTTRQGRRRGQLLDDLKKERKLEI